ncbi:MAG: M56 family metallopeptidase, partial [Verrucomicrobiales bacterium]
MRTIEWLNTCSAQAGSWAVSHLVWTAVVLALVSVVWIAIRKRSAAALGCWLFLLVLLKPLVPFQISVPESWLPFQQSVEAPAESAAEPVVVSAVEAVVEPVEVLPAMTVPSAAAPAPLPVVADSPVSLSMGSWIMIGWAAVAAGLLGVFLWRQARAARWLRHSVPQRGIEAEVAALASQLGLRTRVQVYSNPRLDTPLVYGLFRPVLMLPDGFDGHLDSDQRRWVLLHELAHLKRGDLWVLAFQRLVQIALFFNPSIWIANRVINRLREYACDDLALLHSKIDRRSCGEGFLRVVERARSQPIPVSAALALFERRSDSKHRLARILDSRRSLVAGLGGGGMAILLVLGTLLLPGLRAGQVADDAAPSELAGGLASGSEEPVPESVDSALEVLVTEIEATEEVPEVLRLVVRSNGKIYEAGDSESAIPERRLTTDLKRAKQLNPQVAVIVSAGGQVDYKHVARLMGAVTAAGIEKFSVVASHEKARTQMRKVRAETVTGLFAAAESPVRVREVPVERVVPAAGLGTNPAASEPSRLTEAAESVVRRTVVTEARLPGERRSSTFGEQQSGVGFGLAGVGSSGSRSEEFRLSVPQPGIVKEVAVKRGEAVK